MVLRGQRMRIGFEGLHAPCICESSQVTTEATDRPVERANTMGPCVDERAWAWGGQDGLCSCSQGPSELVKNPGSPNSQLTTWKVERWNMRLPHSHRQSPQFTGERMVLSKRRDVVYHMLLVQGTISGLRKSPALTQLGFIFLLSTLYVRCLEIKIQTA